LKNGADTSAFSLLYGTMLRRRKTELGMDHYEVRKYAGWQHHMLTTRLAHVFLWHLKLRLGKKSACADGLAAADISGGRLTSADLYH
jgi:hypothetical protein